jgi:hypothetical protein
MTTLSNFQMKCIWLFTMTFILLISCKAEKIVTVEKAKSVWKNYLTIEYKDLTEYQDSEVFPKVGVHISKKYPKNIHSVEMKLSCFYGEDYFQDKIIILSNEMKEIELINNGQSVYLEYQFDSTQKLIIPNDLPFDDKDPRYISQYGVTLGLLVNELKIIK